MRYSPEHKIKLRQRILQNAFRRIRTEGRTGISVERYRQSLLGRERPRYRTGVSNLRARVDSEMNGKIVKELVKYKDRLTPSMPDHRKRDKENFFVIFSTIIGTLRSPGYCLTLKCRNASFSVRVSSCLRVLATAAKFREIVLEHLLRRLSTKTRISSSLRLADRETNFTGAFERRSQFAHGFHRLPKLHLVSLVPCPPNLPKSPHVLRIP